MKERKNKEKKSLSKRCGICLNFFCQRDEYERELDEGFCIALDKDVDTNDGKNCEYFIYIYEGKNEKGFY